MANTKNKPKLIVLTPVRNEAWILRAFLAATSLWADKIIIADQMSTDGSREIYREFSHRTSNKCELIVIDNKREDMHQAATRRLLFDKAREVLNGDTNAILFTLDADEFLSGDFLNSNDWKRILQSEPDDAFCWRWMNLRDGDVTHYDYGPYYYWAVHVSDSLWDGMFPDNFIHEWRLPWPPGCSKEKEFNLDELCSLHFARVNTLRQRNKERFYSVSSLAFKSKWTSVSIYRMYHPVKSATYCETVPKNAFDWYLEQGVNINELVDLQDEGQYYTDEVKRFMTRDGYKKYALLDIWDLDWCQRNGIINPQNKMHKMVIRYFSWSNKHRNVITKILDKLWNCVASI